MAYLCDIFNKLNDLNKSLQRNNTHILQLAEEEEQVIELSCDSSLKLQYDKDKLFEFWSSVSHEYRVISTAALKVLLPFATSNLCETGFSALAVIKDKYRLKIDVEKEMRVAISKLEPRLQKLTDDNKKSGQK
ncbi:zinc finger BED domain-containing protein 5-like [Zophobas morio]|uniref:zinc finger BED domain-containing protein 5-like n=1 Tax=Zophobas morio TaxID=2755281 RepID=UPI0030836AB4